MVVNDATHDMKLGSSYLINISFANIPRGFTTATSEYKRRRIL